MIDNIIEVSVNQTKV